MNAHHAPRRRTRVIGISAILAAGVIGLQSFVLHADAAANTDHLDSGERLAAGERLVSADGRYVLTMQGDGNLVEYDAGRAVWASGTNGRSGAILEAQGDGNFVIYAPGHIAVWSTGTSGRPGSVLRLQDDRNVIVYAPGNAAIWSSHSGL